MSQLSLYDPQKYDSVSVDETSDESPVIFSFDAYYRPATIRIDQVFNRMGRSEASSGEKCPACRSRDVVISSGRWWPRKGRRVRVSAEYQCQCCRLEWASG